MDPECLEAALEGRSCQHHSAVTTKVLAQRSREFELVRHYEPGVPRHTIHIPRGKLRGVRKRECTLVAVSHTEDGEDSVCLS